MTIRTRTQGALTGTQTYKVTTQNGVPTSYIQNLEAVKVGEIQTTQDRVTPKFHSRKERGEIFNNPFESVRESRSNTWSGAIIQDTQAYGTAIRWYEWTHGFFIPGVSGWSFNFRQQLEEACTEAAARVENTVVDGTVEVGEARETMRLFEAGTWNLRRQIEKELAFAKRKGYRFPGSAVGAQVLANNWLLYRYGISPFVRSLHDILVVGSKIQTRRETSRGAGQTGGAERNLLTQTETLGFGMSGTAYRNLDWKVSTRAGILYERRNFTNRYGFSLANVPSTIWELTPYSFVVDWFVNTGDFIRALTPRISSVRLATWHGFKLEVSEVYTVQYTNPAGPRYSLHKAQTGEFARQTVHQRRLPYILAPTLYIRENALRKVLTSPRIVDAFALTSQLLFRLLSRVR